MLQFAGSGAAHARGSGKPEVAIVVSTAPTATCALKAGVLGCGSHSATLIFVFFEMCKLDRIIQIYDAKIPK